MVRERLSEIQLVPAAKSSYAKRPHDALGSLPPALCSERLAGKNSTSGRGDLTIYPDHFLTHESAS